MQNDFLRKITTENKICPNQVFHKSNYCYVKNSLRLKILFSFNMYINLWKLRNS